MGVQSQNEEVFHRKLFSLEFATSQRYENETLLFIPYVYETDKTPYQTQVDEKGKERREFFWVY